MKTKVAVTLIFIFLVGLCLLAAPAQHEQDWSNYVRIGAYGLKGGDAVQIVQRARRKAESSGSKSITTFPDATKALYIRKRSWQRFARSRRKPIASEIMLSSTSQERSASRLMGTKLHTRWRKIIPTGYSARSQVSRRFLAAEPHFGSRKETKMFGRLRMRGNGA